MQKKMITTMMLSKNKVLLGLSGGVDSTTAALILKEKNLEVTGLYFDVLGSNQEGIADAKKVAQELGIELTTVDASKMFSDIVLDNFLNSYKNGITPNPCVICNPNVKFKVLIDYANKIGAYYIATGHYAQIHHDTMHDEYFVKMGTNYKKDQSYMMYRLNQDVLSRLILPLGTVNDKSQTRNMAKENNISNWKKADSQEICFLDGLESYVEYLDKKNFQGKLGNFIDKNGKVLGRHKGIHHYTVGQRKGLGIALGKPAFVTNIDPETGDVTLGENDDLMTKEVVSCDNVFVSDRYREKLKTIGEKIKCKAKIRYGSKPSNATIELRGDDILVVFDEPQRGPTPGQSIVFYVDDLVIGGGFIV